jgi:hypothetical protein
MACTYKRTYFIVNLYYVFQGKNGFSNPHETESYFPRSLTNKMMKLNTHIIKGIYLSIQDDNFYDTILRISFKADICLNSSNKNVFVI